MKLSTAQINGLRYYDAEDEYVTAPPATRTRNSLDEAGLILFDSDREAYRLTAWGKQYIRDYVRHTGNGPEDLKARFSFLSGRR